MGHTQANRPPNGDEGRPHLGTAPDSSTSGTDRDRALRLEVRGLSKRYGAIQALDNVSLELRPGEIMALLGENGAGKSTLVKVLAGLVDLDGGSIMLNGASTSLFPVTASQKAGIAVVHQEFSAIRSMSIADNLALHVTGRRFHVWWPPRHNRRARELLARVGLDYLDPSTRVEQLTVAEQQLLEVASVLSRDAQVVIFDEPTAALSDADIPRVLRTIQSLAAEGRSIIHVTHRLPEVFRIADRVTVFRNGRSLAPVAVADTTADEVIAMMLGREMSTMYPPRPERSGGEVLMSVSELQAAGLSAPVSFEIRGGEILGLTGQLGSGASSVVQALAGILPVLGGQVQLRGESFRPHSRIAGIRSGIAYCSPDRKLDGIFAEKSVLENLSSPWLDRVSSLGWVVRSQERSHAKDLAEAFAIDVARLGSWVGRLSGGNQQKVALGKWAGIEPVILAVEEPTRGVDVGARAEIYARLRALCARGMSIIVVSSDTAEIHGLCDTIGTFYRGRLTALRPADEWTEDELVFEVMHSSAEVLT